MLNEIERILAERRELAEMGVGQDDDAIAVAQKKLGVDFPTSYKEFLARWGWISFGPITYFGLGPSIENVVVATERARSRTGLPREYLVICDYDGDEYACLDTSRSDRNECPIVIWDASRKAFSRERAMNLQSFLKDEMLGFQP